MIQKTETEVAIFTARGGLFQRGGAQSENARSPRVSPKPLGPARGGGLLIEGSDPVCRAEQYIVKVI